MSYYGNTQAFQDAYEEAFDQEMYNLNFGDQNYIENESYMNLENYPVLETYQNYPILENTQTLENPTYINTENQNNNEDIEEYNEDIEEYNEDIEDYNEDIEDYNEDVENYMNIENQNNNIRKINVTNKIIQNYFRNLQSNFREEKKLENNQIKSEQEHLKSPFPVYQGNHVAFYDLDATKFKNILKEQSYNYDAMLALQYALNSLITGGNTEVVPVLVKYYLNHLTKISESSYGAIYSTDFKKIKDITIIKIPTTDEPLLHELFIGIFGANDLRKYVPNFVWTYGGFKCSMPIDDGKNVISYCRDTGTLYDYLLLENIIGISVQDFIEYNTADQFIALYLQLLYALYKAYKEIDFTHYDLHIDNTLIKTSNDLKSIYCETENGNEWCNTTNIIMIFDFGRSHMKLNGRDYGYYYHNNRGISANRAFPMHDAYKFLCFSLNQMLDNDDEKFNYISPILNFFNKTDDPRDIIEEQVGRRYDLPPLDELVNTSLLELTAYIRSKFNIPNFTSKAKGDIISCRGQCTSETQIIADLDSKNNIPHDMITLQTYILRLDNSEIREKYNQIRSMYYQFKPECIKDLETFRNKFNIEIKKINFSRYTNILNKSDISELNSIIFMDTYKFFVTQVITYSAIVNNYKDLISAVITIQNKLQIIDDFLNNDIGNLNILTNNIKNYQTSILTDYNKLINNREFITHLNNEDTPGYEIQFYQETLPNLIKNI